MNAIILNIGNELLQGKVVNGNGTWMAAELLKKGIQVIEIRSIADGFEAFDTFLKQIQNLSVNWVICTGGLGPTSDDTTRFDVAKAFGLEMEERPEYYADIEAWFAARNRPCRDVNRVQIQFPQGAQIIRNHLGTAPGFQVSWQDTQFVFMPGVPFEMQSMMQNFVLPQISQDQNWISRELVSYGLGEDLQTQILADFDFGPLLFASLPSFDGLLLRLSCIQKIPQDLDILETKFAEIKTRLKLYEDLIVSWDGLKIPERVFELLQNSAQTLSVAESCTAGGLGALLTRVSGVSQVFLGGVVSYANEVKVNQLQVSPQSLNTYGAVSEQVALEMAQGVRHALQSDWGLSITGIAGPNGGTTDKPVGTIWIGIANSKNCKAVQIQLRGTRELIRQRAAVEALNLLRMTFLKSTLDN